jgi:hypothetical protein
VMNAMPVTVAAYSTVMSVVPLQSRSLQIKQTYRQEIFYE